MTTALVLDEETVVQLPNTSGVVTVVEVDEIDSKYSHYVSQLGVENVMFPVEPDISRDYLFKHKIYYLTVVGEDGIKRVHRLSCQDSRDVDPHARPGFFQLSETDYREVFLDGVLLATVVITITRDNNGHPQYQWSTTHVNKNVKVTFDHPCQYCCCGCDKCACCERQDTLWKSLKLHIDGHKLCLLQKPMEVLTKKSHMDLFQMIFCSSEFWCLLRFEWPIKRRDPLSYTDINDSSFSLFHRTIQGDREVETGICMKELPEPQTCSWYEAILFLPACLIWMVWFMVTSMILGIPWFIYCLCMFCSDVTNGTQEKPVGARIVERTIGEPGSPFEASFENQLYTKPSNDTAAQQYQTRPAA